MKFSFFKEKSPTLIGVDITSASIKMVELSRDANGLYQLDAYVISPIANLAMTDGNVADLEKVAEAISVAWKLMGSRQKRVALALPSATVISKKVSLPADLSEDDMAFQVEAEANQYIPFSLDEVNIDFQVLGPAAKNKEDVDVLIVAARKEKIEDRVAVAEGAGLEVANKEKQALEASQQIEDLELMRTEVYTLRYMKAVDLVKIITDSKQKILSKRGSAVPDIRTNNVFVQDTAKSLEQVQAIIEKTDVPVKQVMIESRLVIADDRYSKALGARFGVNKTGSVGSNNYAIGGNIAQTGGIGVNTTSGVTAASGGTDGLQSNLGVTGATGSFAFSLFRLPAGLLLNLELTAMESDGRGKVVSSPRVTTANQHKAKIASGTEIPYAEASSSGAATISFKSAVLSLEVTPQITPDNKIIMELDVTKDSVGEVYAGVPSIKTQNISTQVLVGNGETAVLGGIYEQTQRNDVSKVPFFGDLPVMGRLFQRKTTQNDRTELLIFVTPKIMDDSLTLR